MAANPVLAELEPDVEALLVNRARGAREHWLVPIDDCYALVGLIRTRWRGLSGGEEVWREIDAFFDGPATRASAEHGDGNGRRRAWPSRVGKPDVEPDARAHEGVKQGNAAGNYEKQAGHLPDGTSTAARSTGINPKAHEPIDPRMPNLSPA